MIIKSDVIFKEIITIKDVRELSISQSSPRKAQSSQIIANCFSDLCVLSVFLLLRP